MKRAALILDIIIIIYLLTSCTSTKVAGNNTSTITGNWQLQTVVTEGIAEKVNIQLMNEAAFNCFVGSNWVFTAQNNVGNYSISKNGSECDALKRNIRWTIYRAKNEPQLLQITKLDDKLSDMGSMDVFRFTVVMLDKNNMQLKTGIAFENRPGTIIYNFVRN
jgi:hypothetical protein